MGSTDDCEEIAESKDKSLSDIALLYGRKREEYMEE
jgi:hypothetical protein